MVYIKNKHNKKPKHNKTLAQKTIISIIIIAIIAVGISVVCFFILDTERQVKTKISHLASDYYENYFYPKIFSGNKDMTEVLSYYTESGFSMINLRQIFLSNADISTSEINLINKYCDENKTYIHFFPEPPYDKTSYHMEYAYSCNF